MEKFEQHTYLLYVGKSITIFCECANCTRCINNRQCVFMQFIFKCSVIYICLLKSFLATIM